MKQNKTHKHNGSIQNIQFLNITRSQPETTGAKGKKKDKITESKMKNCQSENRKKKKSFQH